MQFTTSIYTFLAMLGMILPLSAGHDCTTKYVQGGNCSPGDGSRLNPYNSLALAEADTSWDTLIVLASPVALDGGITLRSGTSLIGEKSPVDGPVAFDQPTITNTSGESNGGNGVVVSRGSVCIKNIYFQDTWASAVNYDNATDLEVCNVLVTGFNQGEVVVPIIGQLNYREIGAFDATSYNSGKTEIRNSIIRDGYSGMGIAEFSVGNKRKLRVDRCEFSGLRSFVPGFEDIIRYNVAIAPIAFNFAKSDIAITNSSFHDMAANYDQDITTEVIKVESHQGSHIDVLVDRCTFRNNHVFGQYASTADIAVFAFDDIILAPLALSTVSSVIQHSIFEEKPLNGRENVIGIIYQNSDNAQAHGTVKHNTFNNIYNNIVSLSSGTVDETYEIRYNTGSGLASFYTAASYESSTPNFINTHAALAHNNFVGGNEFGAISVLAGLEGSAPWNNLTITAIDNCFDGQDGAGFAGLSGYAYSSGGAGNATIVAHNNNISNFFFDIFDGGANVNYFAQENWWGDAAGADNIFNDGTGIVDVSSPLAEPVLCPINGYCVPNPANVGPDTAAKKAKPRMSRKTF